MKIIIQISLTTLFLLFCSFFLLQTPLVKGAIQKELIAQAKEKGIDLDFQKLEGNLPFRTRIHGLKAKYGEVEVTAQRISIHLSLLALFKKEWRFSNIKIDGGKWRGLSFNGNGKASINFGKSTLSISQLLFEGKDCSLRFSGDFKENAPCKVVLAFHIDDLSLTHPLLCRGSLTGSALIDLSYAHLQIDAKRLVVDEIPFLKTTLTVNAQKQGNYWEAKTSLKGGPIDIPLDGKAHLHFSREKQLFSIEDLSLEGPEFSLVGNLKRNLHTQCLNGTIFGQATDLSQFRPLMPDSYLKGKIGAKIDFQSFSTSQDVSCQIEAESLAFYDALCKNLTLEVSFYDLFEEFSGDLILEGSQLSMSEASLETFEIKSTFKPQVSPFEVALRGYWQQPLELQGKGSWQKRDEGIFLTVNQLFGFAFTQPFSMAKRCQAEWSHGYFKMDDLFMELGQGKLEAHIDLTKERSRIQVDATDFPLEFIAFPQAYVSLEGIGDVNLHLNGWKDTLSGNCHIALKRALFLSEGGEQNVMTKGSLQIHFDGNRAQLHGQLKAFPNQYAHFSGSFPIKYQHFPFSIQIDPNSPLCGQLTAEGEIGDLLTFINTGHHRIEGWLSTKIQMSKTLKDPRLLGEIELQEGVYENYYTGTRLEEIWTIASLSTEGILIEELAASDGDEGKVLAKGKVDFNQQLHLPFSLETKLSDFNAVSFDTLNGKFSGNLTISGNRFGALAKGDLEVSHATFRIPDKMPSPIPDLPITFIHPPETITRNRIDTPLSSPLEFDLNLRAPGNTFVTGRGIQSELKGDLHVAGNYIDIVANGKLQLLSGEFVFAGRIFDLTQGELIFNDLPTPSSYISLTGSCTLPGVSVMVQLKGPLTSPKLTFSSNPQLPTSSILSQILFNKDVSEITAAQALQLAQSVIALSANAAPDILEKIRQTFGIDRLTILSSKNDSAKVSVQVGKYVAKGVMLAFSQGADNRNVSIEIDLKKGLRLQAEIDKKQEGGVSLKWHYHY